MTGRGSIRQRLTMVFVFLSISPLILVGLLLSWQTYVIQKDAANALQNEISIRVINEIALISEDLAEALKGMGLVTSLSGKDLRGQYKILSQLQALTFRKKKNVFNELSLLDTKGMERVKVSLTKVFKPSGLKKWSNDDIFSIPFNEKANYFSPVTKDDSSKESLMKISLPLVDKLTGNVTGVLVVSVRLNYFWDTIIEEHISENISVYIASENGMIISHDDPSISLAETTISVPAAGEIVSGFDGFRSLRQTKSFSLGSQGYYLICDYHFHDVFQGVIRSLFVVALFVFLFLAISLMFAYGVVTPIVKNIEDLGGVAKDVFAGDLGRKALESGNDEVAHLGKAMNAMTQRLVADIESRRQVEEELKYEISERVRLEKEHEAMHLKALAQNKLATLGEVATGVAHEINQPLSYIKIIFEAASRDIKQGKINQKDLLEESQESLRQISRISTIIDHLRTFGRADTFVMDVLNLADVWKKTTIIFGERIRNKNISLVEDFGNDSIILGNSLKLEQLFINLLQNSLDAMEEKGEGTLTVRVNKVKEMVEVVFSDTGSGVTEEVREKMFEPFYTTKEVGQGTGLGLAISYGIVQEHRGTIECHSIPGVSTEFTLRFPCFVESGTSS